MPGEADWWDVRPDLPRHLRRQLALRMVLTPVFTTAALLSAYFLLPFTKIDEPQALSLVIGGLAVVSAVYAWQIRKVLRARYALVQAAEALALVLGVYLVAFATTYFLLSEAGPESFSEPLTRLDALYFTLTVFSTVGFGDIAATTQSTRGVVSAQIVGNLFLISLGIRMLTASVRSRRGPAAEPARKDTE